MESENYTFDQMDALYLRVVGLNVDIDVGAH